MLNSGEVRRSILHIYTHAAVLVLIFSTYPHSPPCVATPVAPAVGRVHAIISFQQPVTPTVNPESEQSDQQLTAASVAPSIASTAESMSDV